jgi:hypothetical protein
MKARQIIALGIVLAALLYTGCELELDEMPAKYIKLAETEFSVTELATRTLTAIVLPEFADDVTVTWESADEDIATVTADETDSRKASFKARNTGTTTITATTVVGGHSAGATITVTAGPRYTLKARNTAAPAAEGTTPDNDEILTWKGESWDQTEEATVTGPDAGDPLVITNNETGGTIANGLNTNNTMVYLAAPVQTPFIWKVKLRLHGGGSGTANGVKIWVSRDADSEWTEATSNYKYRQAAIRWYAGGELRTFFMDSASPPNVRNIEGANVAFAVDREVTLEVEHTGTQCVMRYPGTGDSVTEVTTGSFGSNPLQAINPALAESGAGYYPGFSVSGAEVSVTGVTLIK